MDLPWRELVNQIARLLVDEAIEMAVEKHINLAPARLNYLAQRRASRAVDSLANDSRNIIKELAALADGPDDLRDRILKSLVFSEAHALMLARTLLDSTGKRPPRHPNPHSRTMTKTTRKSTCPREWIY